MPGLKTETPGLKTETPTIAISSSQETVSTVTAPTRTAVFAGPSLGTVARVVWLGGALAAAAALLLSLLRVRRLTRTAAGLADAAWRDAATDLAARLGLRREPRVLLSTAVRTPMAGGLWRPIIFLPADASSWTAERRDVVLAHELSHLATRDPLRHAAARLAVACYWFHPLAWLAARQSTLAREQACDEAVLALGIRPSAYARVLLDLAETMTAPPREAAVLPMVERSLLETRVMAILEHHAAPSRLRHTIVPAACAALFALSLAAAQPAARSLDIHPPAPAAHGDIVLLSAPSPVASPAAAPSAPQTNLSTSCWADTNRDNFSGYTDTDARGTILRRIGIRNGSMIIQQRFGETAVCMVAEGQPANQRGTPSEWLDRASRAIVETARGASRARLDILRSNRETQTRWRVNDAERPFDAAAQAWRDAVLAVLDRSWEISSLRGQESTLRGEISTIRGEESTLRGEISTLRGEVSTMRGRQSTIRGEESTLRGEISTIQGHVSSLRRQISSERGAISSLLAARYGLSEADRARIEQQIKSHEAEIDRIEKQLREHAAESKIAEVEKAIRALDAEAKVAAVETEIRNFGELGKVAEIEKQITALNVEGKVADLERQIRALDTDARVRQMQADLDRAVRRLEQALAAIR